MRLTIRGEARIPSKKNTMRTTRSGGMYKDKSVKRFEFWLGMTAQRAMIIQGQQLTSQPVRLTLDVTFGDRRRRDLQNCFGAVCDALEGIGYSDDSQIVQLAGAKRYEKGVWRFEVGIHPPGE